MLHLALLSAFLNNAYYWTHPMLLGAAQHAQATQLAHTLVKQLAPQVLNVTQCWGIPEAVYRDTPAASSWSEFNRADNQGEVLGRAKL